MALAARIKPCLCFALGVVLALILPPHAQAGHVVHDGLSPFRKTAGAACGCAAPHLTEVRCTVWVPEYTTEKRIVIEAVCEPVQREKTVAVCRRVPETTQVTRKHAVMVPRQVTRQETYTVCQPVWREVDQPSIVRVPRQVQRQGFRMVCKDIPQQTTKTVRRDAGCWEQRVAGCRCRCTYKVWVPKIVTEKVPVTVWKKTYTREPYTYTCTVYDHRTEMRKVRVCEFKYETRTRDITCTVYDPEMQTRVENVTTYRLVSEPKQVKYTDYVTRYVEREIDVPVCRMVPKVVTRMVPACCR